MSEDRVAVEPHPASSVLPKEAARWRVTLDGMQNSVHSSEGDADAAAKALRKRVAGGWDAPQTVR